MLNIDKIIIFLKNKEHGIATIFALGFLSMLFMLSAIYITSSMIDRKASENANALQSARMLVQTGLSRSMASLNRYIQDNTVNLSDIYSYRGIDSNDYSDSLADLLETNVDGVSYFVADDYSQTEGPHWQYLPEEHGEDTPIIARFAYMVLAQSGKIDISACIDSGWNAEELGGNNKAVSEAPKPGGGSGGSWMSYAGRDDYEKTSLKQNADMFSQGDKYVTGRPGINVNEIFLRCIDDDNTWFNSGPNTKLYAQKISSHSASPAGQLKGSNSEWQAQWDDFTTMFDSLGIDDGVVMDSFRTHFSLGNPADAEAFWIDNGDGIRDSNEFYKRFQLNRTDWDSVQVESFYTEPISNTSSDTNLSIPWLKNWKFPSGIEYSPGDTDTDRQRNQISANLIDYNDTDSMATTDDEDNPTYVGLEAVPYANEVQLEIPGSISVNYDIDTGIYVTPYSQAVQEQIDAGTLIVNYDDSINYGGAVINEYIFTISAPMITLELINMYSGTGVIQTTGNIKLSIDYLFGDKDNPGNVEVLADEADFVYSSATFDEISEDVYKYQSNYFDTFYPNPNLNPITVIDEAYVGNPIINAFVNHIKVKVTNSSNGDFYDYSYVVDSALPNARVIVEGNGTNTYVLNYQVEDPRQNLYNTDWSELAGDTWGYKNSNYPISIGSNMDSENYSTGDPWTISTAFIRNAPMKSPWELGFIHRAKKWQTLNLKNYNINEWDAGGTGGGNSYSDGDANLLDQIKMTEMTITQGKVNINSQIKETLKILFEKIRVGSDIGSSEGPGTLKMAAGNDAFKVDASVANNLADDVLAVTGTGGSEFQTRSQILRPGNGVPSFWNDSLGLNQVNDAMQEEIIGKFINLCKTSEQNTFYIIVVAQKIKDVGIKGAELVVKKDGNNDGTVRDVAVELGRYDSDGDEIMATQKLFVIVKYTGTKFYIQFLKYLND